MAKLSPPLKSPINGEELRIIADGGNHLVVENPIGQKFKVKKISASETKVKSLDVNNSILQPPKKVALSNGYRTQSGRALHEAEPTEFIVKKEGTDVFGEITPDIAKQMGLPSGKTRLQVGKDETGSRFGVIHIENDHAGEIRKAGYSDATSFVDDILGNWTEIRDANRGGLFVIKRGSPNKLTVIELAPEMKGNERFYSVQSAWATSKDRWVNKKPLLVKRPPSQFHPSQEFASRATPLNTGKVDTRAVYDSNGSINNNIQQKNVLFKNNTVKNTVEKEIDKTAEFTVKGGNNQNNGVQSAKGLTSIPTPSSLPNGIFKAIERRSALDTIRKILPVRTGRTGQGANVLGIFKVKPEVARLRNYGDLRALTALIKK